MVSTPSSVSRPEEQGLIGVRLFASHPIVFSQYHEYLAADRRIRLVVDGAPFTVGIFDRRSIAVARSLSWALARFPQCRPILVSDPCNRQECLRWILQGVWGLICYDSWDRYLAKAVHSVSRGKLWFPEDTVGLWMSMNRRQVGPAPDRESSLTAREREVLELVRARLCNKEIGDELRISERTVKYHVGNLLRKMLAQDRYDLIFPARASLPPARAWGLACSPRL